MPVDELKGDWAYMDGVAILEGGGGNPFPVDERSVGRREVT